MSFFQLGFSDLAEVRAIKNWTAKSENPNLKVLFSTSRLLQNCCFYVLLDTISNNYLGNKDYIVGN